MVSLPGLQLRRGRAWAQAGKVHVHRQTNVNIKRYARVKKIHSGEIEESRVLSGLFLNTDITHPRITLLDCPLEYKICESRTNMEFSEEGDWARAQEIEEEQVRVLCEPGFGCYGEGDVWCVLLLLFLSPSLIHLSPCVYVNTNNNISPPSQTSRSTYSRNSDNNRIALAVGTTIVNRIEDISESDVGTGCRLFRVEKIGDEYFTFLTECRAPKARTILLRGPSKDILNEIDRNLADAMSVACNAFFNPTFCPGGGAPEMAISVGLQQKARKGVVQGLGTWLYRAVADAMEVIPRVLIQNSGGNVIRVLTELWAKRANGEHSWGVNGDTGKIVDMKEYGLYESASVKIQTLKTAIKAARMLFRVDDVVQAVRKEQEGGGGASAPPEEMMGVQ
ncbi:hypothetical protein CVT25_008088 [Psilocybe cyanescens]|uniref:T-complex protein 1 subunit gamma n=1 Tax=Psilocybe cyanescens TaxID=93625 RepID=A0A409X6R7_PSICY|nr:hypothetical protein CVT25_008088 [Psilocybe cyanescens]